MNRFRLFHLEDEDTDAFLIERALQRSSHPCSLRRFTNARDAIDALESMEAPEIEGPHLILSDLKMPGMSGVEFACWLRQSKFHCTPIVIFSGSSMVEDIMSAYKCGANSFATKPVNAHQLNEIISTLLKYWNDICSVPAQVSVFTGAPCGGEKEDCSR